MRFDLTHYWYRKSLHFITWFLLPFSWLFAACVGARRWLYRVNVLKTQHFTIPVIVVGNITAGGTGKTPFVIWLANQLKKHGYQPGIVSRGVGGKRHVQPYLLTASTSPLEVGDEAVLLAQKTDCPVMVSIDRAAAVEQIKQQTACNIVISDDGLQHYKMSRAIEIVMVDGARLFGNQRMLPAGPLRENVKRLKQADFVIINDNSERDVNALINHLRPLTNAYMHVMTLSATTLVAMLSKEEIHSTMFKSNTVHAVAGIGHPQQFFQTLKNAGFDVIEHPFPDHYHYQAKDLKFNDNIPIVMTEKDAVKCLSFADERYWYLAVAAKISNQLEQELLIKLSAVPARGERENVEEEFAKRTCDRASRI